MIGAAFDLDGTLLRSDHSLSQLTVDSCRQLRSQGVWFTLITARLPLSVLSFADKLHSQGPWGALNGAVVFSRDRAILNRCSLPRDVAREIVQRYCRREGVSLNLYSNFDWYVNRFDERVSAEARIVGFTPLILPEGDQLARIDKILLIADASEEVRIQQELTVLSDQISVSRSKKCYLEVTHRDVDKGRALAIAARSVGLTMDCILAVGDGENDISMLKISGYPVAMSHSPESLKLVAKAILGTNDDDSLARYVGKVFDLQLVG